MYIHTCIHAYVYTYIHNSNHDDVCDEKNVL